MKKTHIIWLLATACACTIAAMKLSCSNSEKSLNTEEAEKLFTFEVYPLLESKCFACHGNDPEEIEGQFDIRSIDGMLKGGESGHAGLVPGHPDQSPIYQASSWENPDFQMPPKENDRLTEKQLLLLRNWIAGGAPWPSPERMATILETETWDYGDEMPVETSGALSDTWARRRYKKEDLWAFIPLTKPEIPRAAIASDNGNPVDAFIQQKLNNAGLKPAPQVDKLSLIRRATFDLTGLPPRPSEIAAFLADEGPDAFEKVIDRLLASPHYGEQWGRHWLDVVRYADSDGFSNDFVRPNAWRYRDYVIRSFNDDKPWNEFVSEQIAGDEIDPNDPEMLIATGFLRMGPWEHTGMSVQAETRQFYLDDVTNGVGESFLALPLRCARCHDHKFDPIPTQDYYQIQAVFASVQFAERMAPFLPEENLNRMQVEKAYLEKWIAETNAEREAITDKEENAARQWYREHGKRYLPKRQRMKLDEGQRPPRYYGLTFQDLGYRKVLQKRAQRLNIERKLTQPLAFSVYSGPERFVHSVRPMLMPEVIEGEPKETFILTGGSVYAPAKKVEPGIVSAVATLKEEVYTGLVPNDMNGRRLAFAKWVTDPANPLATRAIVNRIWQYHFSKGLAENANNFGATGKKPTHPALLDWLVQDFISHNWSIKHLHKRIMLSEVYQRSSIHPDQEEIERVDPDNQWLAVFSPRRLAAEEIRDAMLFVSGELNPEQGGIPVRPEINMEVALQPRHTMGSIARAYQPSPKRADRNRRSIYALKLRSLPDPMMEVFNRPPSDLSCENRTNATITPQVFALFNSQQTRDRAVAMALRLESKYSDLAEQLAQAIEWAFGREASEEEIVKGQDYIEKMESYHQQQPVEKEAYPTEVEREMFEEMTGEAFSYTEKLDVYENYEADVKVWEVGERTRALADFCSVLFNANEFIYVY